MYRIIHGADGKGGDAFLPHEYDALHVLSEALNDGACKIVREIVNDHSWYRVELLDGDEWGQGSTLDIALRYALGAHVEQIEEAIS